MSLSPENSVPDLAESGRAFLTLLQGLLRRRRLPAMALLAVMAGGLTACGSNSKGPPPPCPGIFVPSQTQYLTQFAGNGTDLSDIAYEAHVDTFTSYCVYSEDESPNYIRTAIKLQLAATRGPKFTGDKASFKYFVAITGPGGERLKKDVFDVDIDFSKGQVGNITIDEIDPIKVFPKANENGDYYRIYIGLDLTKEQLEYNKRNRRQ
ncbi:MAG TPA: hypothetical protein VM639_09450 [Dongiaceae bacterium]|nr:hypothetical protein [Dongiaceae bacterium]